MEENEEKVEIISEEIRPDDTVISFYNRVQNFVYEKWDEDPEYKFFLLIQSNIEEYNDSQLQIISEPIPSNYEIPLISPPYVLSIGTETIPPIKSSSLVDAGYHMKSMDRMTGVKKIFRHSLLLNMQRDKDYFYTKTKNEYRQENHSYLLASIKELNDMKKKDKDATKQFKKRLRELKTDYDLEYNQLTKAKIIDAKNVQLTLDGKFGVEFEGLLFYEYAILLMHRKNQKPEDRMSSFLFCLLLFQIIKYGDEIIDNYETEIFYQNFDKYSDLTTLIKILFPLLKYNKYETPDGSLNKTEKYIKVGLNPDICETIIGYLIMNFKIYFNKRREKSEEYNRPIYQDDDTDNEIYIEYCKAIDELQIFLKDLNGRINEFINIIKDTSMNNMLIESMGNRSVKDENFNTASKKTLPDFFKNHCFEYVKANNNGNKISIQMKDALNKVGILTNRPGWNGFYMPRKVFAFCVISSEESKDVKISMIHAIDEQIEIHAHQIPEELDNIFAQEIINSIINTEYFNYITSDESKKNYVLTSTTSDHRSFISFDPISDHFKECQADLIKSIELEKMINPFVPRSLLVLNERLSVVIELQSSGLYNIHPRIYSCQRNEDKKKKMDSPFYKLPYAYPINRKSMEFLRSNINKLKEFSPHIRIALVANDYMNFGGNKSFNKNPIIPPNINVNIKKSNYVFQFPSNLFVLSNSKCSSIGDSVKFESKSNLIPNICQTISLILPEMCKIYSSFQMTYVKMKDATITLKIDKESQKLYGNLFKDKVVLNPKSSELKLKVDFQEFLNYMESLVTSDQPFPPNLSFGSNGTGDDFQTDAIRENIISNLKYSDPNDVETFRMDGYLLFCKLPKCNSSFRYNLLNKEYENEIQAAIRATSGKNPPQVEISPFYDVFHFTFHCLEHQGLNLQRIYNILNDRFKPKFNPFILYITDESDIKGKKFGKIDIDIFSEKVALEAAKEIYNMFKDEKIKEVFEPAYPHPIMKKHSQTEEKIDNWVIANNCEMDKEGSEWVGSIDDVFRLQKQFKIDIENKIFQFDYQPIFIQIDKYKKIRKKFEKEGFHDYEYDKHSEILIIKPEDFRRLVQDDSIDYILNRINKNFCLKMCKGQILFPKRLSLYNVQSDSCEAVQISMCAECTFYSIKDYLKDYFTVNDTMNDPSRIVYQNPTDPTEIMTKWKPLDFLFNRDDIPNRQELSLPIGQFLWYLSEQSNHKFDQYIRAWINMAASVAVHQSPMMQFCPAHLSYIIKLPDKSATETYLNCNAEGCNNCFRLSCLRWHDSHPEEEKDMCDIKPIGFNAVCCPNCNVPTFNLFNNIMMFCDRCGCNWCYLCQIKIDEGKALKHIKEFHDGNYNL